MPATDALVACAHCGLPAPADRSGTNAFCCAGCRAAWTLLEAVGLGGYHAFSERRAGPAEPSGRGFEEFDDAGFERLHVQEREGGLRTAELYLAGAHCASCVWLIERAPRLCPGLVSAELDLGRGRVSLAWDPSRVKLSRIASVLDGLGYRLHALVGVAKDRERRAEERRMLVGIGIAFALALNVMTVALATYAGWFGHMDAATERYFRLVSLALTVPAVLGPGRVFLRGAWAALRARTLHMDVPIAIALVAGLARGAMNAVAGTGPVYFDGLATLVFLLLTGRFLQVKAQRAALEAAEIGAVLTPRTARLLPEGNGPARVVASESLVPGARVEVRSGDLVPADGIVLEGRGEIDLSLLTGEARPVPVAAGDRVFAGTLCAGARIIVQVERAGEETRVARLAADVEASARRRAPVVRQADRLAGAFVGVVLALALVTWAVWMALDPAHAIDRAIALLIVTCPCALALATPLAITVAIGRAARAGILIKNGVALELLARPMRLVLDKTGTLTEGRLALAAFDGAPEARPLVLALERQVQHPASAAFERAWGAEVGVTPCARGVRLWPGEGIEGEVAGRRVAVGSPAFVQTITGASGEPTPAAEGRTPIVVEVRTPVAVALDGVPAGRAWFDDPIRADAARSLARLRALGFLPSVLSGDASEVVRHVAGTLGFAPGEAVGGQTPEAKRAAIESALLSGPVAMVGDGVNDAAAIARATVGISVAGGAEASRAASDVHLALPGLAPLVALVEGSRRTMGVLRRNIALSLAYNVVAATLAVTGRIDPLVAAILMPVSSLTVVLASWLGRTFDDRNAPVGEAAPAEGGS
jgi:Cu2+-exporting ATPase